MRLNEGTVLKSARFTDKMPTPNYTPQLFLQGRPSTSMSECGRLTTRTANWLIRIIAPVWEFRGIYGSWCAHEVGVAKWPGDIGSRM